MTDGSFDFIKKKRVIIESPLKGNYERNKAYAILCLEHSLRLGEAPFASHLLYTQALDDQIYSDRELGITAGFCWHEVAELCAAYIDLGISEGMQRGMDRSTALGLTVEKRKMLTEQELRFWA